MSNGMLPTAPPLHGVSREPGERTRAGEEGR